ncbi:N-linked glycosylation glycosyltransferase PglG [hydrothermal vent metagenome]|uniref:N-linked glycosylation glycosyltransferase PglG n=2 Tax=hydrothermal vent metagenome TaxID=652676 RepID=A0A3B1AW76_9ZZZZ
MSYIGVIERYHQYHDAIHDLLASILSGITEQRLFDDEKLQQSAIESLRERYPFVELLYTLDTGGLQHSENHRPSGDKRKKTLVGKDRSQRPYFQLVQDNQRVVVTEPYLSIANTSLCISSAAPVKDHDGKLLGYVVLDIDLAGTVAFLMGDTARRRFAPLFKLVYSAIAIGLFAVVILLLYASLNELINMRPDQVGGHDFYLRPFGIIIYLTLGLAIFDLAKTTFEEEVLMHKDIFRHSSTRRTITRFMAAILIAVSIESLLLMFKSALGDGEHLADAVWMMMSAVGLLIGLGLYVYLGAKAEAVFNETNK